MLSSQRSLLALATSHYDRSELSRDSLQPTLSRIIDWCLSLIRCCIFKRLA